MLGSWATAHLLALGHDTMVCIVTGMAGACSRAATTRPVGPTTRSRDTVRKGHDTADPRAGACDSEHARDLAGLGVAIQKLYCG